MEGKQSISIVIESNEFRERQYSLKAKVDPLNELS
jgi:hypothetical protein